MPIRLDPRWARRAIGGFGAVLVGLGVWLGIAQTVEGVPAVSLAFSVFLVAGPGVVLLAVAVRLPSSAIDPGFYAYVLLWCMGAVGVKAALLGRYHALPDESISSPVQDSLILVALASVAGFGVGAHNARARSHAAELERYETVWDGVVLLDGDERFAMVNEAFCEMTGYDRADILEQPATMPLDETAYAEASELYDRVTGGELEVATMQYDLRVADGDPIPVEARFGPVEFEEGSIGGTGVIRDVSDRRQREQRLATRARQQEAVADLGQMALETDAPEQLMRAACTRVAEVLDHPHAHELAFDNDRERFSPRAGVGWADTLDPAGTLAAAGAGTVAMLAVEREDPIVFESRDGIDAEPLASPDVESGMYVAIGTPEAPWGVLGTAHTDVRSFAREDVDFVRSVANILAEAIEREVYRQERESLIADLEESNERLEQFAYAASHDLQEPLRMVSTYLQLLERRYADRLDEDGTEFLGYAVDGADRMRTMIDGLLQYARVRSRGQPFEPVDLERVVEDVRKDLEIHIAESNAEIQVGALPRVRGDPSQLGHLFQNLIHNAIEYAGDSRPHVEISAAKEGSMWRIAVRDDGVGIDPAEHDQIFEIFERLRPDEHQRGSGIGLALSERIVERHGGEIDVESTPGEGSTFSFTLPPEGEP